MSTLFARGLTYFFLTLQQDNFIHGDLHPGNIFVRFVNNIPKVVLLDVGMTAELNAHSRAVMLGLFKVSCIEQVSNNFSPRHFYNYYFK